MGEAGKWTRILGPAHGAFMTYASLDLGSETAPGQITATDMADVYRVRQLSQETKVYGVIGDPVSRSLSPYIHNPAFASEDFNAVYIPFLVKDIGAFMRRMVRPESREVELNFGGFAVTMPHKQSIIPYLDSIDPVANAIGAVNTVRIEDGGLMGYNTDAAGFIDPLKNRAGSLSAMRVAVIGAGGAARAVTYALKAELADVTVVARDAGKAAELAETFGTRYSDILDFRREIADERTQSYDLIVNATSAGMMGKNENGSLFAEAELIGVRYVYDLVTRVDETPLLREAGKAGAAVIGGIEMLIAQGAKQFEIWTGRRAPIELMRSSAKMRMEGELA
jgi:3-dehydroquinate dehydratase/shikimate dehydrogenase